MQMLWDQCSFNVADGVAETRLCGTSAKMSIISITKGPLHPWQADRDKGFQGPAESHAAGTEKSPAAGGPCKP